MPDLLVAVLEVTAEQVVACLAEVDRPGAVLREAAAARSGDLAADVRVVLHRLDADALALRLLALAVAVSEDVTDEDATGLLRVLEPELPGGWGLPASLPVLPGSAAGWAATGAPAGARPLVAGATVAAARSVGAHAHLPHPS